MTMYGYMIIDALRYGVTGDTMGGFFSWDLDMHSRVLTALYIIRAFPLRAILCCSLL